MKILAKHILDRIEKKVKGGMTLEQAYRSEGYILPHKAGVETIKTLETKVEPVVVKSFIPRPKK